MTITSTLEYLALKTDDWTDFLLPSAVNESKQIVNSKIFSSIFLTGSISFLFIAIALFSFNLGTYGISGQKGFIFFSSIMDIGLIVVIPAILYQNMSFERSNGSLELISITAITPTKIVLGKWQTGLLQSLIFGSIIFPGLIFSYFFNAISISAILIGIFMTFIFSQFAIILSIFLCSLSKIKSLRLGLQIISSLINFNILFKVINFKEIISVNDKMISDLFKSDNLLFYFCIFIVILTLNSFLIVLSSARLSTYSANKSTFPRIFYFILFLELILFIFPMYSHSFVGSEDFLKLILTINSIVSFFFLLEKDTYPRKVFLKYHKKEGRVKKIFKLIFYPGKSSAYLLFYIQTLIILAIFSYLNLDETNPNKYHFPNLIAIVCRDIICISSVYLFFHYIMIKYPQLKTIILFFSGIIVLLVLSFAPLRFFPAIVVVTIIISLIAALTATNKYIRKQEKIRDFISEKQGEN